jgi:hypothetical protein
MCKTLLGKFDAVYIINGPKGLKAARQFKIFSYIYIITK